MNTVDSIISEDLQAVLLLTAHIGTEENEKPLTLKEFNSIVRWLSENNLRPKDMFNAVVVQELKKTKNIQIDSHSVGRLLDRGGKLTPVLEKWFNQGVWFVSRFDEIYPERIKKRLGDAAPPVLYGVGNTELLNKGGLAVVGSRDPDRQAMKYTEQIAGLCAAEDVQIISGGAKGVDRQAMVTAYKMGGTYTGVLAGGLSKESISGMYQDVVRDRRAVLMSPYNPDSGFSVGAAMGRNKYIYLLSDWALVISSSKGKGGTWTGAMENIKNSWTPLLVRYEDDIPDGNRALIKMGGLALSVSDIENSESIIKTIENVLGSSEYKISSKPAADDRQYSLFDAGEN
jgi:predicted Rossmann fold nucleotide-binding protein DprA/Smf involved in DNA uptake